MAFGPPPALFKMMKEKYKFRYFHLVHDIIPLKFSGLFDPSFSCFYKDHLLQVLSSADCILHYSESTKKDLEHFCQSELMAPPSFAKFSLGSDEKSQTIASTPPTSVSGEFCLMVGTIEVRKNHILMIHVWQKLVASLGEQCPWLIIVGRPGWMADEALRFLYQNNPTQSKIIWLRRCYDDELNWLYENCLFTLYPSLYEGWGLPVTESLSHGKFCIASESSSIPEAGGTYCDYHNPESEEDTLNLVQKYLTNRDLLKKKTEYIRTHFSPTTWLDSAKSLILALEANLK